MYSFSQSRCPKMLDSGAWNGEKRKRVPQDNGREEPKTTEYGEKQTSGGVRSTAIYPHQPSSWWNYSIQANWACFNKGRGYCGFSLSASVRQLWKPCWCPQATRLLIPTHDVTVRKPTVSHSFGTEVGALLHDQPGKSGLQSEVRQSLLADSLNHGHECRCILVVCLLAWCLYSADSHTVSLIPFSFTGYGESGGKKIIYLL